MGKMYLFGKYCDKKFINLYLTLTQNFEDLQGIVKQEDFSSDLDISSFCEKYILGIEKETLVQKDVHCAMIQLPEFWQVIPRYYSEGEIQYRGEIKGYIYYKHPYEKHLVNYVEWIDKEIVRRRDQYNRYGNIAFSVFYDSQGKPITKSYYTSDKVEVISYDYSTESYVLYEEGRTKRIFVNETEFFAYLFCQILNENEYVFISSLEMYQWISKCAELNEKNCMVLLDSLSDALSWNDMCRNKMNCVIMSNAETKSLPIEIKEKYQMARYYRYSSSGRKKKSALILTMSDQIETLEELIISFPCISFHIAANTAVSEKLADLEKYRNAHIYPQISEDRLDQLFSECSLYLDINYGYEIYDAIANASSNGLLLAGYEATLHNREYVLDDCVFTDKAAMMTFLQSVCCENDFETMWKRQQEMNENSFAWVTRVVKGEK